MSLARTIRHIVLEALFPLAPAERELFALTPEQAFDALPRIGDGPLQGLAEPMSVERAQAVFLYKDERVSKLVWNIKYKKSAQAVRIGGYALYQALKRSPTPKDAANDALETILIPMPITAQRRRERGFNQTELIADELARLEKADRAAKNLSTAFSIEKGLLVRIQHAARQTLKDRDERIEGAKGIFAVDEEALRRFKNEDLGFKNHRIIVLDDVITTGSTMKAALDALESAGFMDASGIALAH